VLETKKKDKKRKKKITSSSFVIQKYLSFFDVY